MIDDKRDFIRQNTRLQRPAFTPEIALYLADEVTPLWRLTEKELAALNAPPPFWAFAWAGGLAIARFLLDNPEQVAGKRVVDFASGSGLCAIAARKAGAAAVLAVDIDPFSAAAIDLNAATNNERIDFSGANLLSDDPPQTDLILAGDICYEQPLAAQVIAWLYKAHENGARILIGDPGRAYFPRSGLTRRAAYAVPTSRELEANDSVPAGVYTFE